jgi:hypothetical protein
MIGRAVLRHGLSGRRDEDGYLDALNVCFPNWGGRAMFDWCFARQAAGHVPDILRLFVDGRAVAGTAIVYRRVTLREGVEVIAGIVTGSWTLPEARGEGAFTRLIGASREQIASRGGALLLGFVRADNASSRGLLRAGADLTPTFYCRSGGSTGPAPADLQDATRDWRAETFLRDRRGTRFAYSIEEWTAQFVNRPGAVARLEHPGRWSAVVQRTEEFDRILALTAGPDDWIGAVDGLAARAAAAGRRLFVFTMDPGEAELRRQEHFTIVDGFLGVLAADTRALEQALGVPRPEGGARGLFADPGSPWYLGRWTLQSGDRM